MDKNGIDGLLKIMSPELLAGYEKKNLHGKILREVNADAKFLLQEYRSSFGKWRFIEVTLLAIAMAANIAHVSSFPVSAIVIIALLVLFWYVEMYGLPSHNLCKLQIEECNSILKEFRQSVEAVDAAPHLPGLGNYCESLFRDRLIDLAKDLMVAERAFKITRFNVTEPTWKVVRCGRFEEEKRDWFEKTLKATEKFGLVFNKKDLFTEAEKYLAPAN